MKITILIIALLGIFGTGLYLFIPKADSTTTTSVIVLEDITDIYLVKPDSAKIYSLFYLTNKWNGADFQYSVLSDVSYNKGANFSISKANQWLSNELAREKEIKDFQSKVSEILSEPKYIGKNHSSVYLPIAHALNDLYQSKAEKRILLVYSDLMENTPDMTLYDKWNLQRMQTKPGTLKEYFLKQQSLNDLTGIEVHFIYEPADPATDKDFRIVSDFYKSLLEEKGAKVSIGANI